MPLTNAKLRAARAAVAAAYLDALGDPALGEIVLRTDQRHIVARAERALRRDGGCMIAEDVGRGKTFIALALARRWRAPLIVIPASLRATWDVAMRRAGVRCAVITHEALSRGALPIVPFDAIIVDESHHFRTLRTRRHEALVELASAAPVVLLSATPLQNRTRDLAAQLALYLGEVAFSLAPAELARYVIRGVYDGDDLLPIVAQPEWISLDFDDGCVLRALLDLTPPAPLLDSGDGRVLTIIGLVRAWASSRAALSARLRSRLRLATAIEQGIDAGRAPTRREAREWHGEADAIQLGFASLLMESTPSTASLGALRNAVDRERDSVDRLTTILRETEDPDDARICAVRTLRTANPRARILAFSEFASTIHAYYRALQLDRGVGMLTAREARIASGPIGRDELLARFAPVAQHAGHVPAHHAVTLLLTTDLLSEGVNLQDASIVVHLDLPWNPARLAQRVGRLRRPGGASTVRSFLLAPPARAEALLDADARLRRKLTSAEHVIGGSFAVLPMSRADRMRAATTANVQRGSTLQNADVWGAFAGTLAAWRRPTDPRTETRCIVAAARAPQPGWFAALSDGTIVAQIVEREPDDELSPLVVAPLLEGEARIPSQNEVARAHDALRAWVLARELARTCGVRTHVGPLCGRVLARLAHAARAVPRDARAHALEHIGRLRTALQQPLPLGVEQALATHADTAPASTEILGWLERAEHLIPDRERTSTREPARVVALILVGPCLSAAASEALENTGRA